MDTGAKKKRSHALILISLHPPSVPCAESDSLPPLYYVNSRVTDTIYSSYNTINKYLKHKPARLIPQHVRPIFRRKSPAVTHVEGRPCHHPLPWVPYLMPSHGQIGAQAQSKWLSRNGGKAERSDSRGIA